MVKIVKILLLFSIYVDEYKYNNDFVGFEVITVVILKMAVF